MNAENIDGRPSANVQVDGSNTVPESSLDGHGSRLAREGEMELRRLKGEVACAECRRLRVKCDKQIPCATCTRRGCQNICPNGSLQAGQGNRFVLSKAGKLHVQIAEMSKRIRQLEDALQIEHDSRTTESHPLLSEELLTVKNNVHGIKPIAPAANGIAGKEVDTGLPELNAMGLLSISDGGNTSYIGTTGTEYALVVEAGFVDPQPKPPTEPESVSASNDQANPLWPFQMAYAPTNELQSHIEKQLPSRERASALCEAYLQNVSCFFRPVHREQIIEELIPKAYRRRIPNSSEAESTELDLHELALLLMVFACGSSADLTLPQFNSEAEQYRQLAHAALGLKSVFDCASLCAVQALCMICVYDVFSGRMNAMGSAWKFLSLAFSLGISMGLHRDPARWYTDPQIVQRRRQIFWELHVLDIMTSISIGRPPNHVLENVDCEMPEDVDVSLNEDGSLVHSIWYMRHIFSKEILLPVTKCLSAARSPTYSDILQLDQKLRTFNMARFITTPAYTAHLGNESPHDKAARAGMILFNDVVLMYIHRNYFIRALLDNPSNPMRHNFAPSFLAAYRSAMTFLKDMRRNYEMFPSIYSRYWPLWNHALGAAVVIGSVAWKSHASSLAPLAFMELGMTIALFERESAIPVVKQSLPILLKLQAKARDALIDYRLQFVGESDGSHQPSGDLDHTPVLVGEPTCSSARIPAQLKDVKIEDQDDPDEVLEILRGSARLLHRSGGIDSKRSSASPTPGGRDTKLSSAPESRYSIPRTFSDSEGSTSSNHPYGKAATFFSSGLRSSLSVMPSPAPDASPLDFNRGESEDWTPRSFRDSSQGVDNYALPSRDTTVDSFHVDTTTGSTDRSHDGAGSGHIPSDMQSNTNNINGISWIEYPQGVTDLPAVSLADYTAYNNTSLGNIEHQQTSTSTIPWIPSPHQSNDASYSASWNPEDSRQPDAVPMVSSNTPLYWSHPTPSNQQFAEATDMLIGQDQGIADAWQSFIISSGLSVD